MREPPVRIEKGADLLAAIAVDLRCRKMAGGRYRVRRIDLHPHRLERLIETPTTDRRFDAGDEPKICGVRIGTDLSVPFHGYRMVIRFG